MDAVTVISVIVGGILAAWIFEDSAGWLIGMLLGFLLAKHFTQKRTLVQIEKRLREIEDLIEEMPEEEPEISSVITAVQEESKPTVSIHPVFSAPESPPFPFPSKSIGDSDKKEAPPEPAVTENAFFSKISEFFTQGNVVLRVGLLVLFFGVAFLLKYAADRNVVPIELRLQGGGGLRPGADLLLAVENRRDLSALAGCYCSLRNGRACSLRLLSATALPSWG